MERNFNLGEIFRFSARRELLLDFSFLFLIFRCTTVLLGLNQIYLDLISNGTGSSYFVHILDTYGHIVGM